MELHQAIAIDDKEQGYIVTPIHPFLLAVESFNYSSGLNNVSIVETINESVFEGDTQKQHLSGYSYFNKPILIACENKKTKVEIEKTHRYTTILYSLLSQFRGVFLDDLLDGWLPSREVCRL